MNQTRSEQGAIATIVAILFGIGVVFGVMALAIDVGGLMVERRQLQNGADATAMSLAESCALDNCVAGADGLETLVDANARDGDHAIASQCAVNATGTTLPGCPRILPRHHELPAACRRRTSRVSRTSKFARALARAARAPW